MLLRAPVHRALSTVARMTVAGGSERGGERQGAQQPGCPFPRRTDGDHRREKRKQNHAALTHLSINLIYGDLIFWGDWGAGSYALAMPCKPVPHTPVLSGSASPTSFVVLAVRAEGLHGHVAARSSPAWLADAVPAVLVQRAPAIAVAQSGAALCQRDEEGEGTGVENGELPHPGHTEKGH